jgi:chorismate dehydratase
VPEKIKISVVEYLNSKPFVYGLYKSGFAANTNVDIQLDIPSVCAAKLLEGKVDIGLVPVALLPRLKEYHILTNHCIGASGKVNSVLLLSQVPLAEIESVLLDFHSNTSVALTRILAEKFWKIAPVWENATEGFIEDIKGKTAGVVIGDRALEIKNKYRYQYDLAEEWMKFTGLPFVFACWVANRKLPLEFIEVFTKAIEYGMIHKQEVIRELQGSGKYSFDVEEYLTEHIRFDLDEEKRKGMELFLSYL